MFIYSDTLFLFNLSERIFINSCREEFVFFLCSPEMIVFFSFDKFGAFTFLFLRVTKILGS
jgi:hypothetical protein